MKSRLIAILILLAPSGVATAQDWALEGFDPVGYREQGRALPGRSDIATMWKGRVWHFASEENRARFEADPRAFAPGLNGFCPVALSEGREEPGDPQHFVIVGQRVYFLNSDADQRKFLAEPRDILMQAKRIWASLN